MSLAASLRARTFGIAFLYSVPFGLLLYFNSSFLLARGLSEQGVALALSFGYLLSVFITLLLPSLLRSFGNRRLFVSGLTFAGVVYLALALTSAPVLSAILLAVALAISTSLYALLDIFLAATSANPDKVGGRRGIFATLRNGAYIVAQLITSAAFAYASFNDLYGVVALIFFGIAILSSVLFESFRDPVYEHYDWPGVWRRLSASSNLRNTFVVQFLLRIFYSIMVVYTPIYLHDHVGIPYESLGFVFAIMIVPFILLEIPIGRLEDKKWGEQEVIVAGFLITGLATGALAFITTSSVLVWAAALFTTRIGAALLDIGSETYFFKQVRGGDSGEVSAFRVLFPFSYIAGPLLAAALLFVLPLQYLFVALGLLMLAGILPALALKDTR